MKEQQNNTAGRNRIFCLSAVVIITSLTAIILLEKMRSLKSVNAEQGPTETSVVERSIKIPIGERVFLAQATVNNREAKTDGFIRESINSVARYFSVLEWPEDRPVVVLETNEEIVITWPLPPELETIDAYKPDYTARAFIDKKTKEVRFLVGS